MSVTCFPVRGSYSHLMCVCRGVVVLNNTLSFELQPAEEDEEKEEDEALEKMHELYSSPRLNPESGGCGVSNTPVPPIQVNPQHHRVCGMGVCSRDVWQGCVAGVCGSGVCSAVCVVGAARRV